MAAAFGLQYPLRASRAAWAAGELERRVFAKGRGKRGLDLSCTESPTKAGARRLLLADDLDGLQVEELLAWWGGAAAVVETSPNCHQVLLASPCSLSPEQYLAHARGLVARFRADAGATASGQLHRFPGSLNFKPECLDSGGPFLARLALARGALTRSPLALVRQLEELAEAGQAMAAKLAERASVSQPGEANKSNSERAMSWTLKQLHAGVSDELILAGLGGPEWLAHHDPRDWPARTLRKAKGYFREHREGRRPT